MSRYRGSYTGPLLIGILIAVALNIVSSYIYDVWFKPKEGKA